jgi:hypothetical protein
VTEADMPDSWIFNGYFAFVLYGPHGLTGKTFLCLMENSKNVTKVSRQATKKKNAEVNKKEREANVGGGRGFLSKEQLASLRSHRQEMTLEMFENTSSLPTRMKQML